MKNKVKKCSCGKPCAFTLTECNSCGASLVDLEITYTNNVFMGFIYGLQVCPPLCHHCSILLLSLQAVLAGYSAPALAKLRGLQWIVCSRVVVGMHLIVAIHYGCNM